MLVSHLRLSSNVNIQKMLLRQLPRQMTGRLVMLLNFIFSVLGLLSTKLGQSNQLLGGCPIEHSLAFRRGLLFE